MITRGNLTQVPAGFPDRTPETWEEASDDEKGATAYRVGLMLLDQGMTPAGLRERESGTELSCMAADAMETETAARQARAAFRVLTGCTPRLGMLRSR